MIMLRQPRWLAHRLFSEEQVRLGFKNALGSFCHHAIRTPTAVRGRLEGFRARSGDRDEKLLWFVGEKRGAMPGPSGGSLGAVEGRMGTGFEFARHLEQGQAGEPMPLRNQKNARVWQSCPSPYMRRGPTASALS